MNRLKTLFYKINSVKQESMLELFLFDITVLFYKAAGYICTYFLQEYVEIWEKIFRELESQTNTMTYAVQFLTTLKQKLLCNECVTLKLGILKTIIIASTHCTCRMVVLIVCRSCIVLDCMTCESRVVKCIHNSVFKIQDRITGSLVFDWRTCSVCINQCNRNLFILLH